MAQIIDVTSTASESTRFSVSSVSQSAVKDLENLQPNRSSDQSLTQSAGHLEFANLKNDQLFHILGLPGVEQSIAPDISSNPEFQSITGDLARDLPENQFRDAFVADVRAAARDTRGDTGKFLEKLGQYVDQNLQTQVEQGKLDPTARESFNINFEKEFDALKSSEAGKVPRLKFWQDLSHNIYAKMQQDYSDLPDPLNIGGDNPAPAPDSGSTTSASIKQAHDKMLNALKGGMSPEDLQRMDKMMQEFEKRGNDRVAALVAGGHDRSQVEKQWQDKIVGTYDQLSDMVSSDRNGAVYDKATRAHLAENAMYLFMDPTGENQGQHGTCWIESEINLVGLTNHPDDMARLLKEVALTGTYTDKDGKKYDIAPDSLKFPGEEARWTISNAERGARSPVGAIFDRVITSMEGRTDGGTSGGTASEAAKLMKRITGDSVKTININSNNLSSNDIARITSGDNQKDMLENGGVVLVAANHMFDAKLVNNDGKWEIVGDNQWGASNDQLIGLISDLASWNVQTTRRRYVAEEGKLDESSDHTVLV